MERAAPARAMRQGAAIWTGGSARQCKSHLWRESPEVRLELPAKRRRELHSSLSVAVLLERAKLMFLSSRAPVPVREPRLCEEPTTFELLVLAQTAIAELKPLCPALFDRSLPLSERPCGLLATEEAGGFLVRDAMGCPLLHREDALSYGETVRKRAAKAAKAITAAEKACRGPYARQTPPRRQLRRRMLVSGCCELLSTPGSTRRYHP